jgi:hypothetical protein
MIDAIRDYFDTLTRSLGQGWNQFWFRPSGAMSLSVLRILTGLMALWLHLTLLPDLESYFGPEGMLPVETVHQLNIDPETGTSRYVFSYLTLCRTSGELQAAHAIGAVILIMFIVGAFSRVTAVLALAVVLSTIHRGVMLTAEVEPILTMVMCYLCLGPTGAHLSVDRWLARRKRFKAKESNPAAETSLEDGPAPTTSAQVATRLIQVHLAAIYAVMVLSKLLSEAWWDGEAVYWLANTSPSALVDLTWLYAYPKTIDAWTHAIVLFELSFPLLIWVPLARPLVLSVAVVMWLSLALLTGLVPFCLMMLVANLAFVSPLAMQAVVVRLRRQSPAETGADGVAGG